ncbi:hypothetical protein E5288_WYG003192 [Bos mutus]|uniref:Uncharacterized protein n=1 Tax=Bos mutus TaxID=72004 RepID=A0A6B0RER1_9CETA|nr:hypothetical protein [Bos mutus]
MTQQEKPVGHSCITGDERTTSRTEKEEPHLPKKDIWSMMGQKLHLFNCCVEKVQSRRENPFWLSGLISLLAYAQMCTLCTPMREAPPPLLLEPSDAPLNTAPAPATAGRSDPSGPDVAVSGDRGTREGGHRGGWAAAGPAPRLVVRDPGSATLPSPDSGLGNPQSQPSRLAAAATQRPVGGSPW